MQITNTAAGILAAVCVTAGAGGAYLLTRSSPTPAAQAEAPAAAVPGPAPGVEASEAIVSEPAAVASAPRAEAPEPAPQVVERKPVRRTETRTERRADTSRPMPEAAEPSAPTNLETRSAMPPALEPVRPAEVAPIEPPAPPAPQYEDLVIAADSVIGLQVETPVTSERARVEDEVVARVTRDVKVGDRVAVPAGARAHGEVTLVERGGKMRDRARLGVRFTSIVLADGTRVPIESDTIVREGDAPGGESAAKIGGGAIGGAIIGGILGGAKGAIIGSTAGAGAGTAAVIAGGRNPATLPSGAPVTVRLLKPATVTVEK